MVDEDGVGALHEGFESGSEGQQKDRRLRYAVGGFDELLDYRGDPEYKLVKEVIRV
jgi:hypothetical protein